MSTSAVKRTGLALAVACAGACGEDPVAVDPAVAPFVGTWDAVVFTVAGDAPPNTTVDVLASFGPFWISIQPSGLYQATFEFVNGGVQYGQLTVQGSSALTLDADNDPPAPGVYLFAAPDSLIIDGATQFDINGDFVREPAQLHLELLRQ